MNEEKTNQIICLIFLLACLALAVCFEQVCRQRDEIARLKAAQIATPAPTGSCATCATCFKKNDVANPKCAHCIGCRMF